MVCKILVVEDEPFIALDIKRRLLRLNYQVVAIANSAETALKAVAQFQPDLVLMDIQIEGDVDGIQTADQIQTHYRIPIVFLTAHADEVTLNQAKASQPFGYIVKPFENHDLSTAIEIALSRYHAELLTQRALEYEKELHELKSRFVSVVSHEFRNPLAVIQLTLDMLNQGDEVISPEKKKLYIKQAKDSTRQMKELLEDVLVLGESEAGKLQCQLELSDLTDFCRSLIESFQMGIGAEHSIIFTVEQAIEPPQTFYDFDSRLLRYILMNLLSNAVKYSPKGSDIKLKLICCLDYVIFQIQDQGIGIPAKDQPYLFNAFHRGSNVQKIPGTGLGLSIVKQCIDAHSGTIDIESKESVGTAITVKFNSPTRPYD